MSDVKVLFRRMGVLWNNFIKSNLRQRGIGNPNAMKLSRCIKEIERICGVRNGSSNEKGNNRIGEPKVSADQSDVANMFGLSVDTLQNYKKLTELVPELQDWVETGVLAPTTAIALIKYMSPSEQEDFISSMDITQRITKREVQQYIDRIKQLEILICFNFTFIVMFFRRNEKKGSGYFFYP